MRAAFGFRCSTGWTTAVTLVMDAGERPRMLDRRRFELQAPEMPREVYHVAAHIDTDDGSRLIAAALDGAVAAARDGIAAVRDALPGDITDVAAGLIIGRRPPIAPHSARLSHAGMHWAEGEAYRWAVLEAARDAGLEVTLLAEAEVADVPSILGLPEAEYGAAMRAFGAALGPPWTQREKAAAAAAWLALAASSAHE
ncbi:MAG TPA: hypothetical protein VH951_07305 [Dehalococcoidia bacterium]